MNKTCTLTSRSRLESYKRLVSVSSRSHLGLELLRLMPIPDSLTPDMCVYTTENARYHIDDEE